MTAGMLHRFTGQLNPQYQAQRVLLRPDLYFNPLECCAGRISNFLETKWNQNFGYGYQEGYADGFKDGFQKGGYAFVPRDEVVIFWMTQLAARVLLSFPGACCVTMAWLCFFI